MSPPCVRSSTAVPATAVVVVVVVVTARLPVAFLYVPLNVRKYKEHVIFHINVQTFVIYPDSGMVV